MQNFEYDNTKLRVEQTTYGYNGQPAVVMYIREDDEGYIYPDEVYAMLTVNLDDGYVDACNADVDGDWFYQYVDVNNLPGIIEALTHVDWAMDAGIELRTRFVTYPLYKFKKEAF